MANTTGREGDPPTPREVSRRDALKRIAIAGGAAWTLPAIQTVHMERAYAATGSPSKKCYTVYIDKQYGCEEAPDLDQHVFKCLAGKIEQNRGGCSFLGVSFDPDGTGRWFVTLDAGSVFVAGFSRVAGRCIPSPTPPGSTGVIEFDPAPPGQGGAIQHVELTYCRDSNAQNTAQTSGSAPTRPNAGPSVGPTP
jgi:hypothetical protein